MMQSGLELCDMLTEYGVFLHHIAYISNRMQDGSMCAATHTIAYLGQRAVGQLLA